LAHAFDLDSISNKMDAPSFAQFAKGGYHEPITQRGMCGRHKKLCWLRRGLAWPLFVFFGRWHHHDFSAGGLGHPFLPARWKCLTFDPESEIIISVERVAVFHPET
jgi:hypothetical protein